MKKGWIMFCVLLCVAFLVSCGKKTEPDETKGELVQMERGSLEQGSSFFLKGEIIT